MNVSGEVPVAIARICHKKWREPEDKFVGHVNDVWVHYNKDNSLDISVNSIVHVMR